MAEASIFLKVCNTNSMALAALVVVGIIEYAAARALLKSLCGASEGFDRWYEWTVDIKPFSMPKYSSMIFSIGARQFVVQDALDMILCSS